jgi:hypothetical protein
MYDQVQHSVICGFLYVEWSVSSASEDPEDVQFQILHSCQLRSLVQKGSSEDSILSSVSVLFKFTTILKRANE